MFKVCRRFFFPAVVTLFLTVLNPAFIPGALAGSPGNNGKKPDQLRARQHNIIPTAVHTLPAIPKSQCLGTIGLNFGAMENIGPLIGIKMPISNWYGHFVVIHDGKYNEDSFKCQTGLQEGSAIPLPRIIVSLL